MLFQFFHDRWPWWKKGISRNLHIDLLTAAHWGTFYYKAVDMNSSMWARETFNPKSSSKLCDPEVGGQVSTEWQVWLVTDYITKSDPTPTQGHLTHKSTWCGASSVGELSPLSSLILNASTWKPTLSISDESGKYQSVQFGVKYLELKESLLHVSV